MASLLAAAGPIATAEQYARDKYVHAGHLLQPRGRKLVCRRRLESYMPGQVLEVHTFEHAHFMYHWFLSMTPRPGFITYYLRRFHLNGNHFVTKTARPRRAQRCARATRYVQKRFEKHYILLPAAAAAVVDV